MESTTSKFKVNDFVWAKLARYPPWPAIIMEPNPLVPPKRKNSHWIYFFGSHDYAWVEERHIRPFEPYKDQYKATNKKLEVREAIEELEEIIENIATDPNYEIEYIEYTKKERKRRSKKSENSSDSSAVGRKRYGSRSGSSKASSRSRKKSRSSDITESEPEDQFEKSGTVETTSGDNCPISQKTFGFIAAHIYNEAMIKNLIKSGHRIIAYCPSLAMCQELENYAERMNAYFKICQSPRECVRIADIVLNHQTDARKVTTLVEELGVYNDNDNLLDGKGYVELTALDPDVSMEHAELIRSKGATYIEAVLVGELPEAINGVFVTLVAGPKPAFQEVESCFKVISKKSVLLKNIGGAMKTNMILQTMKGTLLAGYVEGFALADKSGLRMESFQHLFDHTSMASQYLARKGHMIIKRTFEDTEEPVQVIQEELFKIRQLTNWMRQPLPMASQVNEIFKHARRLGYDNLDAACIYNRTRY